ncbi:MAG: family 10 glycosylhydrolase, partial [Ignavibacteriales bacterium]|nr:family 10 glycosylhydrolase [Ignavibacteriales bacterium]
MWINPYRSVFSSTSSIHSTHISKTQPSWHINYGGTNPYKFLDPGLPQVREYVIKVVMDIVRRYNIDGVHYDDYFYPYGGMTNQDSISWAAYGGGWADRGDWRRNNVNTFVAQLHDSIKAVKPWVKYGVSPFGIWKSGVPSGISGLSAYSQIYCDAVNWITNKKIDYLTPQLYWRINNGVTGPNGAAQDFNNLMPWWSGQIKSVNRHLYVGHAAHNLGLNASAPYPRSDWPAQEMQDQVSSNRANNRAQGSVFFSSKWLTGNIKGIGDSLRNNQYKYRALPPPMPWLDSIPPLAPMNLSATIATNSVTLQWQKPAKALDNDTAQYFVIYRVQSPDTINTNKVQQIIKITWNDTVKFIDNTVMYGETYTYAVTSFDKLDNESNMYASINLTVTGVEDVIAAPLVFALAQNYPNPFNPTTTFNFTLSNSNQTTLKVYDLLGREVATIADELLEAGSHTYQFSGANLASGVYLYRLVSGSFVETKKMVL